MGLELTESKIFYTLRKPMNMMQPLEVGIIVDNPADESIEGDIVLRTASNVAFEVIDLSKAGAGNCWSGNLPEEIKVRPLKSDEKITLELSND